MSKNFGAKLRIQQKQLQKMLLSAKMQQSMHMLQMSVLDLQQLIAEELSTNPFLEDATVKKDSNLDEAAAQKDKNELELDWLEHDSIWLSDYFDKNKSIYLGEKHDFKQMLLTTSSTLQEELLAQFRLLNDDPQNMRIAEQIIGNINDNGYLVAGTEEIADTLDCPQKNIEEVLEQVQTLDPPGVGARSLKECLLIQLKKKGKINSLEMAVVENHLDELAAKKYKQIGKSLNLSLSQVKTLAHSIIGLNPKPGRNFAPEAKGIIPDIILEKTAQGHEVVINSYNLPVLSISQLYKNALKNKECPEQTLNFLKEKLKNAQDMLNGLKARHITLKNITECLLAIQDDFMQKGLSALKPMTLNDIARKLDIHPSTVSRAIANKFIQTPYGTVELKKFFSHAVGAKEDNLSNQKVMEILSELIKTEQKEKPISDQKIIEILKKKNIQISRRTITKYRNILKIPTAHLRKR